MDEEYVRNYTREEEFLNEYGDVAGVAARALNGKWQPDYKCDDAARKSRDYFKSSGELAELAFQSAAVYRSGNRFSSAQILLETSSRVVTIRVKLVGDDLVAEKIVDRPA